ncbi:MAG: hypothetical protein IPM77_11425 [Crocinitomicaceae bacterium]|nr:hypothetical protein [Crocinitomicaceae bacterium]
MKKSLLIFSFFISSISIGQSEKEPEQIVSFETVSKAILRVFPEAYEDFLTICFTRINELIVPESATFLIPDKYFKKKLNQKTLEERAQTLLDQLELSPACQSVSFDEPTEYSWQEWDDKK